MPEVPPAAASESSFSLTSPEDMGMEPAATKLPYPAVGEQQSAIKKVIAFNNNSGKSRLVALEPLLAKGAIRP